MKVAPVGIKLQICAEMPVVLAISGNIITANLESILEVNFKHQTVQCVSNFTP